jgi:hypothetical protein
MGLRNLGKLKIEAAEARGQEAEAKNSRSSTLKR